MTVSARRNEVALNRILKRQEAAKDVMKALSKVLAAVLIAALIMSAFLAVTKALPIFYTVSEKTVTVASGDTLWGIAQNNMGQYPGSIRSYLAEVRRLNSLEPSEVIVTGTTLVLPVYSYVFS